MEVARMFADQEARLSDLDRGVGDGDHGATMRRGFTRSLERLAAELSAADREGPAGPAFTRFGYHLLSDLGGATAPLFARFFLALGQELGDHQPGGAADLGRAIGRAAEAVGRLSGARPGEKTLLDALLPAGEAASSAWEAGEAASSGSEAGGKAASADRAAVAALLEAAARAAEKGALRTAEMEARHGRARLAPERALGRPDAGAASVALLFAGFHTAAARLAGKES